MKIRKNIPLVISMCAMLFAWQAEAQTEEASGRTDHSDAHMGEAINRDSIDVSELPVEVMKSFEESKFSDMEMISVHRIEAKPNQGSSDVYSQQNKESNTTNMQDSTYQDKPADMRKDGSDDQVDIEGEKNDIGQTYYQDTYEDANLEGRQTERNTANTDDGADQVDSNKKEGQTNTYYEIEVSGEAASYSLLFDEEGTLKNTELLDRM